MHFWIPSAQNSAGFWPKDNCCDIYRTDWRSARLDWVEHEEAGTLVWGKADGGCEQGEGNRGREMGMVTELQKIESARLVLGWIQEILG